MALAGQTVTIVNSSGKIVKSSKHIFNVFTDAKTAYSEKKAELRAQRESELNVQEQTRRAQRQLEALTVQDGDDRRSNASSRRHSSETSRTSHRKAPSERSRQRSAVPHEVPDASRAGETQHVSRQVPHRPSPLRHATAVSVHDNDEPEIKALRRRHTDGMELTHASQARHRRRASLENIDMDLAYGEMPPPLPDRKPGDELELQHKMSGLQKLLDECNCVQHSVTATIDKLQKNPEALAAVGLALGEISNIAMKMAPGALTSMKGAFPAIVALLASPQFAIAAGVGVGVTIIALGGYKIIKKIQARNEENRLLEGVPPVRQIEEVPVEEEEAVEELREISGIERWRRGIADAEADSLGTSVDGEFITPHATRTLVEEGRLTEADLKPPSSSGRSHRRKKTKSTVSSKSKSRSGASTKSQKDAKKEPSGLKMLFMGRSA